VTLQQATKFSTITRQSSVSDEAKLTLNPAGGGPHGPQFVLPQSISTPHPFKLQLL